MSHILKKYVRYYTYVKRFLFFCMADYSLAYLNFTKNRHKKSKNIF